jgi:hypothetical protein
MGDPRYGVLGAVNHINGQLEQALQAPPAEAELHPYKPPQYEDHVHEAPLYEDPSYEDLW